MKIIINTYPLAFHTPGGGEVQLLQTKRAIEGLGHEVDLFDQWSPKLEDADIVHFFSVFGGSQVFCEAVKRMGIPLVISPVLYPIRDLDQYPMQEISNLLNIADMVLPNSVIEANLLASTFGVEINKFQPVCNGVDASFVDDINVDVSLFRKHFEIDYEFVLNVANIEPRKNQLELAKAVADSRFKLVILGSIRDEEYFKRVMEAGKGRVVFLGRLPNTSLLLKSAYKSCALFVLPSILETPGLAALEAASMGCKILVTSEGATKEYFQDFVHYFDPQAEKPLLECLKQAWEMPKPLKIRKHILNNFTWTIAAEQTLAIYRQVI